MGQKGPPLIFGMDGLWKVPIRQKRTSSRKGNELWWTKTRKVSESTILPVFANFPIFARHGLEKTTEDTESTEGEARQGAPIRN